MCHQDPCPSPPGIAPPLKSDWTEGIGTNDAISFSCLDSSYSIFVNSNKQVSMTIETTCQWDGSYDIDPSVISCQRTGCIGFESKQESPYFLQARKQNERSSSLITDLSVTPIGESIWYHCINSENFFDQIAKTNKIAVECLSNGYF